MGDFAWRVVADKLDGLVTERYTYFSVNGTGVDYNTGFPADIGRALNPSQWYWQPVAYPAATFPMGPSVDAGVAELVRLISITPGKFAIGSYSQGSLVSCKVWRDHILNPNGDLHHRLPDMIGHVTYGNPMRCPGIANGNAYAGQALPAKLDGQTTGGIAGPDCLTAEQTPDFMLDFANDGDLYASAPVGANPWTAESNAGHDETMIYNIVQNFNLANVAAIVEEVIKVLLDPWTEVVPLVEALYNGGLFFAMGMNAPHYLYSTDAAIQWLNGLTA